MTWIFYVFVIKYTSGIEPTIFLNTWAVEIKGGHDVASKTAAKHGFRNLGSVIQHSLTK